MQVKFIYINKLSLLAMFHIMPNSCKYVVKYSKYAIPVPEISVQCQLRIQKYCAHLSDYKAY